MPPVAAYLIGAGPGARSLLTLRAAECLARCAVIVYDEGLDPGELARLAPAAAWRSRDPGASVDDLAREVARHARGGHVVGRLALSDGLLFGPLAAEAEALAAAGVVFEIVPGVTTAVAAAAFAGIALPRPGQGPVVFDDIRRVSTHRSDAPFGVLIGQGGSLAPNEGGAQGVAIAPSGEGAWSSAEPARASDEGVLTVVEQIASPRQRVRSLAASTRLSRGQTGYVGAGSAPRASLQWFSQRPLFGKRVVVTRAAAQASSFVDALRERGADASSVPTIVIGEAPDPAAFIAAVSSLASYDWVALTSPNGVARVLDELARQSLDARAFGRARLAAIGPGTAAALAERGLRADLVAGEFRGEGLARDLLDAIGAGHARVLLPRALVARDALPDALRAAGHCVDVVAAYRTSPPPPEAIAPLRSALARGDVDVVTLTSSSTVEHLVALLGGDAHASLAGTLLASIGPVTTATAERLGLRPGLTAERYSLEGLTDALETYFARGAPR